VPIQTLFMNFTIQVFQAVGLGYGAPSAGLMERTPRPSSEALLGRRLLVWLSVAGAVMGLGTLGVLFWSNQTYGDEAVARTMGMIAFSVSNIAFSFCTKDERRSVFSLDVMGDRPFLYGTAVSILVLVLMPNLGLLQRLLGTVPLTFEQWVVCVVVGLLIVPVSEIRKLLVQVPVDQVEQPAEPAQPATAAA
jgi:Ca2+-transporting ATPase